MPRQRPGKYTPEADPPPPQPEYEEVYVDPTDVNRIPFKLDCQQCIGLRNTPMPGLDAWVSGVASHMANGHKIMLMKPKATGD